MTTIKSYTDLEQSKKLSKILKWNTADMTWANVYENNALIDHRLELMPFRFYQGIGVPCWSLAALISILPRFIEFKGEKYYLRFMKEYVEYANDEISITGRCLHTTGNDNLVDACVEMIIKLKELNLL